MQSWEDISLLLHCGFAIEEILQNFPKGPNTKNKYFLITIIYCLAQPFVFPAPEDFFLLACAFLAKSGREKSRQY